MVQAEKRGYGYSSKFIFYFVEQHEVLEKRRHLQKIQKLHH